MKNPIINRPWFIRLLCMWLALSVLMGSSGFVVVDHWCLMSGKKVETRLMPKECLIACRLDASCPQGKSASTVHKTPCCKEVAHYEHLKTEQGSSVQSFSSVPLVDNLPDFAGFTQLLSILLPSGWSSPKRHFADDPLTRSGRSRLISLCTWLI